VVWGRGYIKKRKNLKKQKKRGKDTSASTKKKETLAKMPIKNSEPFNSLEREKEGKNDNVRGEKAIPQSQKKKSILA